MNQNNESPAPISPTFKINNTTILIILVILIPAAYTIVTHLQSAAIPTQAKSTAPIAQNEATAETITAMQKLATDSPTYEHYNGLGLALYQKKEYNAAIESWKKALEYNPKSELAWNNLAAAYGAINSYDDEIKACEKALAINPNFDLAKRNMAWAQSQKK